MVSLIGSSDAFTSWLPSAPAPPTQSFTPTTGHIQPQPPPIITHPDTGDTTTIDHTFLDSITALTDKNTEQDTAIATKQSTTDALTLLVDNLSTHSTFLFLLKNWNLTEWSIQLDLYLSGSTIGMLTADGAKVYTLTELSNAINFVKVYNDFITGGGLDPAGNNLYYELNNRYTKSESDALFNQRYLKTEVDALISGVNTTIPDTLTCKKLIVEDTGSQETIAKFKSSTNDCSITIDAVGEAYLELINSHSSGGSSTHSWGIGTNDDVKLHFNWKPIGTTLNPTQNVMTMENNGNVAVKKKLSCEELEVNGLDIAAKIAAEIGALTLSDNDTSLTKLIHAQLKDFGIYHDFYHELKVRSPSHQLNARRGVVYPFKNHIYFPEVLIQASSYDLVMMRFDIDITTETITFPSSPISASLSSPVRRYNNVNTSWIFYDTTNHEFLDTIYSRPDKLEFLWDNGSTPKAYLIATLTSSLELGTYNTFAGQDPDGWGYSDYNYTSDKHDAIAVNKADITALTTQQNLNTTNITNLNSNKNTFTGTIKFQYSRPEIGDPATNLIHDETGQWKIQSLRHYLSGVEELVFLKEGMTTGVVFSGEDILCNNNFIKSKNPDTAYTYFAAMSWEDLPYFIQASKTIDANNKITAGTIATFSDNAKTKNSPAPLCYLDEDGNIASARLFDDDFSEQVFGVEDPDVGADRKANRYDVGLVPASNGETDKFLRGDGTWNSVPLPSEGIFNKLYVLNSGSQERIAWFKSSDDDCSVKIEGQGEAYLELQNSHPSSGSTTHSWGIGCNDGTNLEINWKPSGTTLNPTQNVMTMTNGGKVGIKKSPSEVLDVNGNVKATKFIGDGSDLTGIPKFDSITSANKMVITNTADGGTLSYISPQTDFISEGTNNLYYTNDRVDSRINTKLANGTITNVVAQQMEAQVVVANSDIRLKDNIKKIRETKLDAFDAVEYHFKGDKEKRRRFGLIAQDVEEIYPELVYTGEDDFKGVNYTDIITLLVKENQDLKKRMNDLEKYVKNNILV